MDFLKLLLGFPNLPLTGIKKFISFTQFLEQSKFRGRVGDPEGPVSCAEQSDCLGSTSVSEIQSNSNLGWCLGIDLINIVFLIMLKDLCQIKLKLTTEARPNGSWIFSISQPPDAHFIVLCTIVRDMIQWISQMIVVFVKVVTRKGVISHRINYEGTYAPRFQPRSYQRHIQTSLLCINLVVLTSKRSVSLDKCRIIQPIVEASSGSTFDGPSSGIVRSTFLAKGYGYSIVMRNNGPFLDQLVRGWLAIFSFIFQSKSHPFVCDSELLSRPVAFLERLRVRFALESAMKADLSVFASFTEVDLDD